MAKALQNRICIQGDKMKNSIAKTATNLKSQTHLKLALILTVLGLLTACGTSKSSNPNPTDQSSTRFDVNSTKALAQCNKASDARFSFNSSIVSDQAGQISNEWIKLKFNVINSEITKAGNVIKFFKWKVTNGQAVLSETPLEVSAYDLNSGQTTSASSNSLAAEQIKSTQGLYINLADPEAQFQVLKVVAYNSQGQVIGNLNSLIPSFFASPADYKFNSDGSVRAQILQDLHLLKGTTTTGAEAVKAFSQYCF